VAGARGARAVAGSRRTRTASTPLLPRRLPVRVIYWFGVCYWIQFVLAVYGGIGAPRRLGGVHVVLSRQGACTWASSRCAAGIVMRTAWAIPGIAALWVAIEATHGPLGFAWLALGNAGIEMGVPLRLAPYTGVYGLSFVFAMMSARLAIAVLRRPRRQLLWVVALPLLILLPAASGFSARHRNRGSHATEHSRYCRVGRRKPSRNWSSVWFFSRCRQSSAINSRRPN